MATIESYKVWVVRKGKDGNEIRKQATRYLVRYRQPNRKTTMKRGFETKVRAKEFASTVEVDKMTGSYVAPSLGMITVGELAPAWLSRKESDVAKSNYRMLESAWRCHVQPVWGDVRISDIELNAVERWIAVMRRKSGATTVIRAYGVLASVLDDALKSRRLSSNPARGVTNLPKKRRKRRIYLTPEDVARLAAESGEHRVLVLVLAHCGIRWGEAVALRVRDVEFLKRRLNIHDNAVQLGVDYDETLTKGRVQRSVPVPQFVLNELSVQCRGKGMGDLVFGDGVHYLPRPKSDGGWFAGAVKRAKVQKVTPHDLRHTCASIAISAGVNVLALSRMLGHTSAKVTLDTYADLFDTDLDAVAAAIDKKCAHLVLKPVLTAPVNTL